MHSVWKHICTVCVSDYKYLHYYLWHHRCIHGVGLCYEIKPFEKCDDDTSGMILVRNILKHGIPNIKGTWLLLSLPIRGILGSNCDPKNDCLTRYFHDFPPFFQANAAILPQIKIHDLFLQNSFQIIIHQPTDHFTLFISGCG